LPPHQDDNIKVYYIKAHADAIVEKMGKNFLYEYKDRKIEIADIVNDRRQMVLLMGSQNSLHYFAILDGI
jgi:hypothetical protein